MPIIETSVLTGQEDTSNTQAYNGLDCMMTLEIFNALSQLPDPNSGVIYNFSRALQAPVIEMSLRGFNVNMVAREKAIAQTKKKMAEFNNIIQQFSQAMWDRDINPNSSMQLKDLFYNNFKIKPVMKYVAGEEKMPMDRKAMEKLESQLWARPMIAIVLAWRDLARQLQLLESEIDDDWRFRSSFNIAGTTTGRWSSSKSSTGSGGNAQNVAPGLRFIFTADDGFDLYGYDLEQAESREVGLLCGILFGDWTYLNACERGDLHTTVSRLIWPNLGWTGNDKEDRKIADQPYYRAMSYRDLSKRGGHGCVTADHEVLTPDGWVGIDTKPDVIMQWNGATANYIKVDKWTDKTYEGIFHEWENDTLSINMTDDHRVYFWLPGSTRIVVATPSAVPSGALIPTQIISYNSTFSEINDQTTKLTYFATKRVYCPTVSSGAFYIRRNNKVSITGNSNYLLKPKNAAEHLKIPVSMAEEFQSNYYSAFSAIPKFHQWVAEQLQTKMYLTNVFGRRRDFFDRPDSDETIRKAVAYLPQSATGDRLNLGLYRIWKHMPHVQLVAQVHDAVYFQAPNSYDKKLIDTQTKACLEVPLYIGDRKYLVPSEGKVGFNWGNYYDEKDAERDLAEDRLPRPLNTSGLKKLKF
jgi:DNA polymerase I-like protein with 3'-5' exonuclease and polymerase domains